MVSSPNHDEIVPFSCTQCFDASCFPCERRRKHHTKIMVVLFFTLQCVCIRMSQLSFLFFCNETQAIELTGACFEVPT